MKNAGFTLLELLLVVILLSVLAAIIIPNIGVVSEDTRISALQTSLSQLRNAIDRYYIDHDSTYPGVKLSNGNLTSDGNAPQVFTDQLTKFTDIRGQSSNTKDATHIYGPYLRSNTFPSNPFANENDADKIVANVVQGDLALDPATAATGTRGWQIWPKIGHIFANDNTILSNGTHTASF